MDRLTASRTDFIESQPMFFVATAAAEGRVNLSPKGLDTLRVLDERRIAWLNLSGSGNETAAHVANSRRIPRDRVRDLIVRYRRARHGGAVDSGRRGARTVLRSHVH